MVLCKPIHQNLMKKNLNLNNLIFIVITFISCACNKKTRSADDALQTSRQNYNGNELKTNGYYFLENGSKITNSYVFYRNGVLLNSGGSGDSPDGNAFLENNFINSAYITAEKDRQTAWGLFTVNNNNIRLEHWLAGEGPLKAYIKSGTIINDSTFKITKVERQDGTETIAVNETYSFKKITAKPDSSNRFVK